MNLFSPFSHHHITVTNLLLSKERITWEETGHEKLNSRIQSLLTRSRRHGTMESARRTARDDSETRALLGDAWFPAYHQVRRLARVNVLFGHLTFLFVARLRRTLWIPPMTRPSFAAEFRVRATDRFGSRARCLAHNVMSVAFFHNPDKQYRILLPFIKEGFECGDRAFHVVDPKLREEHLRRLESAGIAVTATQHRRQLEVATVEETFLRGGRFNPDAMLALIQETLKTGATLGFPLTRFIAHVAERILEDGSNADEWIKCENKRTPNDPSSNRMRRAVQHNSEDVSEITRPITGGHTSGGSS